jgi:hypothetical protein
LNNKESGGDITNESSLGFGTEARSDQIGNLGDDEYRNE